MSEIAPPYWTPSSLYEPLELSPEQILQAYAECFTSGPGVTVLRHLYEGICTVEAESVQDLGALRVYQKIVNNIRMYHRLQARRARG